MAVCGEIKNRAKEVCTGGGGPASARTDGGSGHVGAPRNLLFCTTSVKRRPREPLCRPTRLAAGPLPHLFFARRAVAARRVTPRSPPPPSYLDSVLRPAGSAGAWVPRSNFFGHHRRSCERPRARPRTYPPTPTYLQQCTLPPIRPSTAVTVAGRPPRYAPPTRAWRRRDAAPAAVHGDATRPAAGGRVRDA